ncbi:peptidylprolyl isomerase [Thiorhodococcus mannitoliphagus]|uniref:Periplasmic chaperone PpiD n=1 Tax=Thiorhodococcus mannitoliphagus TaxID=329406 RepID=A0A6P1DSX6_9GAMM|nr:SurA N-terminal domain-containing protein [Thiorhodococcus mannitoliphagus]NEX20041.1 peptidylprolyl isomerase [Thiorhodococcus mannitoliphagus]
MLQTIRDRAQGWIAWVIVILISIPFALWGIQSYLGVGGEPIAATVNGVELPARELDRRVQQARTELRQRLGAAYDPAEIDDKALRDEVLEDMIRETLLLDEVRRLGLRVSNQDVQIQILLDPAFQKDGRFDKETYERLLQYQGMSPAMYEAQLRQRLAAGQLARAISASALATSDELEQYQRLIGQQRELSYSTLALSDYQTDASVDDAEITAFYEANSDSFRSPEQVKLDYLLLDSTDLAAATEVTEEDLRNVYAAEQARFAQPERREVRHILLKVPEDAEQSDVDAVAEKIKGIRERILAGESFDALAKEVSEDPGSASKGGSLGMIESGIMVPAFDQVAFAAEPGKLSEPVRTQFGYHLIEVTKVVPAQIKPFEEVEDELRAGAAKQGADRLYYDLGERLANISYESSDSLEPAAEELGLSIQHSDWIGRDGGGDGILAQPKVIAAAFSDDVLGQGLNSDLIEPERDRLQAIVLRVAEHREASVKPLAEVRDEIVAQIKQQRAKEAAKTAAESLAEQLRQSKEWATVDPELEITSPGLVGRNAPEVPRGVLDVAFKLAAPSDGSISVGTATLDNGDAAVVRLSRVQDGEVKPSEDGRPATEVYILTQLMGRQLSDDMLQDMESRADIERMNMGGEDGL